MTLRAYLITMTAATALCWVAWFMVLALINPESTSALGFALFYISLFFSVSGTLAIFSLFVRLVFKRRVGLAAEKVVISFRQGILLSTILVASLILKKQNSLTWWNSFFLIGGITVFEFFLLSLRAADKLNYRASDSDDDIQ